MTEIDTKAREALLQRRAALTRLYQDILDERWRLSETHSPDWPDQAVTVESTAVLDRLSSDERRELLEIDAALERIEQGCFGVCESCGGAVGRLRLRALPEARLCIACSETRERSLTGTRI